MCKIKSEICSSSFSEVNPNSVGIIAIVNNCLFLTSYSGPLSDYTLQLFVTHHTGLQVLNCTDGSAITTDSQFVILAKRNKHLNDITITKCSCVTDKTICNMLVLLPKLTYFCVNQTGVSESVAAKLRKLPFI